MLSSQYTGGSNAGGQGNGTNSSGTLSGSDLWLSYSAGFGAGSSSSGASGGSSSNLLTLLSQYQEGSNVGRQGNGTVGTLSNADLWRLYWSGAGAGSSSCGSDEGSLADDPAVSVQYTGGSGGGRSTPLVYNPESDGPPVFHSGVWTGDDERVQFVQTADTGNQGTDEGDTSQSDDKSRARSWWGIRGWFLGDEPIDDGGAQVVQTANTGRTQRGVGTTAGDWLDRNFGGGTFGEPDLSGRVWAGFRGLFSVAPIAGEISDGAELISGVGPNGEKLTPGQRGATALGTLIPFVPAGVARKGLRPLTDKIDDAIEFMGDAGKAAGKNADSVDGAGRFAGDADDAAGQLAPKGKTHGHHSDPKFMGGDPKQPLTDIPVPDHQALHKDLNDFLHGKTDAAGNHMRPQRGNSAADIQQNFTQQERLDAITEFYKKFRATYPDAARDFFKQHPHLE